MPTTHNDAQGSAAGVVQRGRPRWPTPSAPTQVELITYSTTQAVNALLEGDVAVVGVLGLGRQPDLRKAAKRTRLDKVELAPDHRLPTVHELVDLTGGFDEAAVDAALDRLGGRGRHHDLRRRGLRPRRRAATSGGPWSWPSPAASRPAGRRR